MNYHNYTIIKLILYILIGIMSIAGDFLFSSTLYRDIEI